MKKIICFLFIISCVLFSGVAEPPEIEQFDFPVFVNKEDIYSLEKDYNLTLEKYENKTYTFQCDKDWHGFNIKEVTYNFDNSPFTVFQVLTSNMGCLAYLATKYRDEDLIPAEIKFINKYIINYSFFCKEKDLYIYVSIPEIDQEEETDKLMFVTFKYFPSEE